MTRDELHTAIERSEARTARLRRLLSDLDAADAEQADREFYALLESFRGPSLNIKRAAEIAGTSERTAYRFAKFVGEKRGRAWVLDETLLRDLMANGGETGAFTACNSGQPSN
jgi:hypothetical protein